LLCFFQIFGLNLLAVDISLPRYHFVILTYPIY
jgi:hypothetical protein